MNVNIKHVLILINDNDKKDLFETVHEVKKSPISDARDLCVKMQSSC